MTDKILDLMSAKIIVEKQEDNSNIYIIKPSKEISEEELITLLQQIYDIENSEDYNDIIYLKLKGLKVELLSQAIKYSLSREDLKNPLMLLNIINLLKIYNTLDDSFFENDDVYVSSIEELLDLKLSLLNELKDFTKKVSIYFMSLFKSYNKITFSPLDKHIKLPNIYSAIFLSCDILTLSGIFSTSEPFSTSECVFINESFKYVSSLLMKNSLSLSLFNSFLESTNGNKCE